MRPDTVALLIAVMFMTYGAYRLGILIAKGILALLKSGK